MLKEKFVFCPPEGRGIVLASASPRRKDLLKQIGINNFKIEPADIDERELSKELPNKYVLRIAKQKAEVVSNNNQQCFVIAVRSGPFFYEFFPTKQIFDTEFVIKPGRRQS